MPTGTGTDTDTEQELELEQEQQSSCLVFAMKLIRFVLPRKLHSQCEF